MLLLSLDIADHGVKIGSAHPEDPESALPGEPSAHPPRRAGLDLLHRVRVCQREWNLYEHVQVVFHAADFMHENLLFLANACQVGPQMRLRLFVNQRAPLFCTEHDMYWIVQIAVRHVSRLRRSTIISHLTHGAAVGYPVGAPLALGYVSAIGSCVESIHEKASSYSLAKR